MAYLDHLASQAGGGVSRRRFLVTASSAAGGLAIGFVLPGFAGAAPMAPEPWDKPTPELAGEVNAWILIEPDESVVNGRA